MTKKRSLKFEWSEDNNRINLIGARRSIFDNSMSVEVDVVHSSGFYLLFRKIYQQICFCQAVGPT